MSDTMNALERVRGFEAAEQADELAGLQRDNALDAAQAHLKQALQGRAYDAASWLELSRVRFLQANAAGASPILLADSAVAAARAEAITPRSAEAPARLALALSYVPERRSEAVGALARSYARSPVERGFARTRIEAGARLWTYIPLDLRARISDEVCLLGAEGDASVFDIAANVEDPMASAAFEALRQSPRCSAPVPQR